MSFSFRQIMTHCRRRAFCFLGIVVTSVLLELVVIAECGKKGHHQNNMEELLLLTGILAKVLQKKEGHHKHHPIPIPVYIPVHHGGGHHHHHHG